MLYSIQHRVALAHYPKTAGSALARWFRGAFPDAASVCAGAPHLDVRHGLARLTRGRSLPPLARACHLSRAWRWPTPAGADPALCGRLRIIGVVRSPLAMMGSLFEYWQRPAAHPNPRDPLVCAARDRDFRAFVGIALSARRLKPYEEFFQAGGPAWPDTRLLHFDRLEDGLRRACADFGLAVPTTLAVVNAAPRRRPLVELEAAAGPLAAEVRRTFRWYYDTYESGEESPARPSRGRGRVGLQRAA